MVAGVSYDVAGSMVDDVLGQRFERCCDNLAYIERKLARPVPEGKRSALLFQRDLLRDTVIPRLVATMQ